MKAQHLVIGATGKTGSRVVKRLQALGYSPKQASRNGETHFDWNQPISWENALSGVTSVYLTYYPDLAMPKAPGDIQQFCELAKTAGVSHITLLSGRGEPAAQKCEAILQASGLSWTIVRASWFNQNFSDGLFHQFVVSGKIALPVSDVQEPFVDIDDIAEVVVESLNDRNHNGKLYEVTGPELLNFKQLAETFSDTLSSDVAFEAISLQQFVSNMQQLGLDEGAIGALQYLFTEVLDGRNEYTCDGIEQALGRPGKTFKQFVLDNAKYFEDIASSAD